MKIDSYPTLSFVFHDAKRHRLLKVIMSIYDVIFLRIFLLTQLSQIFNPYSALLFLGHLFVWWGTKLSSTKLSLLETLLKQLNYLELLHIHTSDGQMKPREALRLSSDCFRKRFKASSVSKTKNSQKNSQKPVKDAL